MGIHAPPVVPWTHLAHYPKQAKYIYLLNGFSGFVPFILICSSLIHKSGLFPADNCRAFCFEGINRTNRSSEKLHLPFPCSFLHTHSVGRQAMFTYLHEIRSCFFPVLTACYKIKRNTPDSNPTFSRDMHDGFLDFEALAHCTTI